MKNKTSILPLLLFVALSLLAVSCSSPEPDAGYRNVTLEQAHQAWRQNQQQAGKALFLDVRTPAEYGEGHVTGAKLLPVQQLAERMSEVPKDRPVYIYCLGGVRSSGASNMLVAAGYTNILNMPDAFPGWKAKGYPIEQE